MYRNREIYEDQEPKSYSDCEEFLYDMTQWNKAEFEDFFPKALINEVNNAFEDNPNTGCG